MKSMTCISADDAIDSFKNRKVYRSITFIESVRGCNNKTCPSYKTVCNYGDFRFMSLETLRKVVDEIANSEDVMSKFDVVDIWPYGCGDPTQHPQLKEFVKIIRENLNDNYHYSMSIDSKSRVRNDGWAEYCTPKIMHKFPDNEGKWLEDVEWWNNEYGGKNVSHSFMFKHVSKKLFDEINNIESIRPIKGRGFHYVIFGSDTLAKDVSAYDREEITYDPEINVKRELFPFGLACRSMFSWDGSLRKCLVAATTKKTFRDLVTESPFVCNNCFRNTGGEMIIIHDDYIQVYDFACCVSWAPL